MVIKLNLMDKNKRYNSIDRYYKAKYGKKVAKISLNGNFSCPNKDGTKGFGGCIYCSASGSGDFAGDKTLDILSQFKQIKTVIDNKWPDSLYMPYLQANSKNIDELIIKSDNPDYQPKVIRHEDLNAVNIIGEVVGIIREV